MEFAILGPLEVAVDGREIALRSGKQRVLLVFLLLHANEPVSAERLIDALWGESPPGTAGAALQNQVVALRRLIGREAIETLQSGYRLNVAPGALDLDRLQAFREAASAAGDPSERAALLRQALALWRGTPLADVSYESFAQGEISRLEELEAVLLEERVDADLARGLHAELVPELEALVAEQPLRERPRAQLMLALYRAARQADALRVYQETRRLLSDELGIEPSPSLQQLHHRVLLQDAALEPVVAASASDEGRSREVRKTVTVVFVRSAETAGPGRDPEAVRARGRRITQALRSAFERHGAHVDELGAGTAMAVFGVPVVHEDDALRAARAALEARGVLDSLGAQLGVALAVHVGIESGEVVTGAGLVEGDVVAAAQALERSAAPAQVLVGKEAARLLRDAATLAPAGDAFVLEDAAVAATRRLDAPLVDREQELLRLETAFAESVRHRACRLLTVLGVAGVGKSRLVEELVRSVEAQAVVLRGRCLPYGEGITFWPLYELVLSAAGIAPAASAQEARAKLEALLGDDGAAGSLAGLVGLGEPSDAAGAVGAVRTLFERVAVERPLLVVLDDLHLAEPAFLDLVEQVAARVSGVAVTICCVARPELIETRPSLVGDALRLEPLSDDESSRLLRHLLDHAELDAEALAVIRTAAAGNPLFLEEIVASLIDDGTLRRTGGRWAASGDVAAAALPSSIQVMLSARLDRLAEETRTALECAAVEGEEFGAAALRALVDVDVDRALAEILEKDLARPTAAEGERFRFRHALIRDVAYREIPKTVRAELHARFAEWVERESGDRFAEIEEVAAYHLEQAHRLRSDVGFDDEETRELGVRAGRLLASAGGRARARADVRAAVRLLARMEALLPPDDPERVRRLVDLGRARLNLGDFSGAHAALVEAEARADSAGAEVVAAHARLQLAQLRTHTDKVTGEAELRGAVAAALDVFEGAGDDDGVATCLHMLAVDAWNRGRMAEAGELAERALARLGGRLDASMSSRLQRFLATLAVDGPTPVPVALERCRVLRQGVSGDRAAESWIDGCAGLLAAMDGEAEAARRLVASTLDAHEDAGNVLGVAFWRWRAAQVELLAGDAPAGERFARLALEIAHELGEQSYVSVAATTLAEALLRQGRESEADVYSFVGERTSLPTSLLEQVPWRATRARLLTRAGHAEAGVVLAAEAVEQMAASDALSLRGDAQAALAEALAAVGRRDEAERASRSAVAAYESKGNIAAVDSYALS